MFAYEISILKKAYKTFFRFWHIYALTALASFSLQVIALFVAYLRGSFDPSFPTVDLANARDIFQNIAFIRSLVVTPFNFVMSLCFYCWSFQIVHGEIQTFSDFFDSQKAGYRKFFSKNGIKNFLKLIFLFLVFFIVVFATVFILLSITILLLNRYVSLFALIPDAVKIFLLTGLGILFSGAWILLFVRLSFVLYLLFERPQSSLKEIIRESFVKTKPHITMLLKFAVVTMFSFAPLVFVFYIVSVVAPMYLSQHFFLNVFLLLGATSFYYTFVSAISVLSYMYMADSIMHMRNNRVDNKLK